MNTMGQRDQGKRGNQNMPAQVNDGGQGLDLAQYILDLPYYNERMGFQMRQEEAEHDFEARRIEVMRRLDCAEMQMREMVEGESLPARQLPLGASVGIFPVGVRPMRVAQGLLSPWEGKRREYESKIQALLVGIEKGKRARNHFTSKQEEKKEELLQRKQELERQIESLHWWQTSSSLVTEKDKILQDVGQLELDQEEAVRIFDQEIQRNRDQLDGILDQMEQELMGECDRVMGNQVWATEAVRQRQDLDILGGRDVVNARRRTENRLTEVFVRERWMDRRATTETQRQGQQLSLLKVNEQDRSRVGRQLACENEVVTRAKQNIRDREQGMAGGARLGRISVDSNVKKGHRQVKKEWEKRREASKKQRMKVIDEYPAPKREFFGSVHYGRDAWDEMRDDLMFWRNSNLYNMICFVNKLRKGKRIKRAVNSRIYNWIEKILDEKEGQSLNLAIYMLEEWGVNLRGTELTKAWNVTALYYTELARLLREAHLNCDSIMVNCKSIDEFISMLEKAEENTYGVPSPK